MLRAFHKPIAWLLIMALAMISGVGEGLHFLPGCGHTIEAGNQVLVIGLDFANRGMPIDDRPSVESSKHDGIPMWDEADCPICSLLAQTVSQGDSVQFVVVAPLAHDLPFEAILAIPSSTPRLCLARAPPLG